MHDHTNCTHRHDHHTSYNRSFAFGISLNVIFVIIETIYGFLTNSLALLADAGHNLSDVATLLIAWGAIWLATKKPTPYYTFGFRKSSILSIFFNAIFLLIAVGIILWEALHRMLTVQVVEAKTVIIIATIGIAINSFTALLFFKNKNNDQNIRGVYLHMAADALISLGVVISAIIISYTSWYWLDPMISVIISLIIIYGTWQLLKDSAHFSMDAVPPHINPQAVKNYLASLPNVKEVHDLHIWAISTTETALTVHLTVNSHSIENSLITNITAHLKNIFSIHHPTIQIELYDKNFECHFKPEDIL